MPNIVKVQIRTQLYSVNGCMFCCFTLEINAYCSLSLQLCIPTMKCTRLREHARTLNKSLDPQVPQWSEEFEHDIVNMFQKKCNNINPSSAD